MYERNQFGLREITENDLDRVLGWRNQSFVRDYMFNSQIITRDMHLAWFKGLKEASQKMCLIFEYEQRPVGVINLTFGENELEGTWGFYLGYKDLPKGFGKILGILGLEYAFEKLRLNKVIGKVLVSNIRSISFHKTLGFSEHERIKKHNDAEYDVIVFFQTDQMWKCNKPALASSVFQLTEGG